MGSHRLTPRSRIMHHTHRQNPPRPLTRDTLNVVHRSRVLTSLAMLPILRANRAQQPALADLAPNRVRALFMDKPSTSAGRA